MTTPARPEPDETRSRRSRLRDWTPHLRTGFAVFMVIVVAGLTTLLVTSLGSAQNDADDCVTRVANWHNSIDLFDKLRAGWTDDGKSWAKAAIARQESADVAPPGSPEQRSSQRAANQYRRNSHRDFRRARTLHNYAHPNCSTTVDYWPFW